MWPIAVVYTECILLITRDFEGYAMASWNIQISDETDRIVKEFLAHSDGGDLATFVDQAVRKDVFWQTVKSIQDRNHDLSPEDAQRLADDALADARAGRP